MNAYSSLASGQYTSADVADELTRQDWRPSRPNGEDLFDALDKNHDGRISREEFIRGMSSLEGYGQLSKPGALGGPGSLGSVGVGASCVGTGGFGSGSNSATHFAAGQNCGAYPDGAYSPCASQTLIYGAPSPGPSAADGVAYGNATTYALSPGASAAGGMAHGSAAGQTATYASPPGASAEGGMAHGSAASMPPRTYGAGGGPTTLYASPPATYGSYGGFPGGSGVAPGGASSPRGGGFPGGSGVVPPGGGGAGFLPGGAACRAGLPGVGGVTPSAMGTAPVGGCRGPYGPDWATGPSNHLLGDDSPSGRCRGPYGPDWATGPSGALSSGAARPSYATSGQNLQGPFGQSAQSAQGIDDGDARVIDRRVGAKKLVKETIREDVQGMRPQYVIEKVVEVPETIIKEREKQVKKPSIIERVIEVPKPEVREVTRTAPTQIQHQEQIVEVPQVVVEERVIHRAKKIQQERLIEVPKIEYVEKIEYFDTVEYREVPVDKIVEVPEIEYRVREVEQLVPQTYVQEYFVDNYTEVPVTQVQEVERIERVPVYPPAGESMWTAEGNAFAGYGYGGACGGAYGCAAGSGFGPANANAGVAAAAANAGVAGGGGRKGHWIWMEDGSDATGGGAMPPQSFAPGSVQQLQPQVMQSYANYNPSGGSMQMSSVMQVPAKAYSGPGLGSSMMMAASAAQMPATMPSSNNALMYQGTIPGSSTMVAAGPPTTSGYEHIPLATNYAAPSTSATPNLFDAIDLNGDGKISREEFNRSFGGRGPPLVTAQA